MGFEVPNIPDLPVEEKLVTPPPPPIAAGFRRDLLKPEKPVAPAPPPSFEAAVVAKGDGPAAPANPGFSGAGFGLKMDDVDELLRELKGDASESAKAAILEEANAEDEVVRFSLGDSSLGGGGFEEAREPNGDTMEVFEKKLLTGFCHQTEKRNQYSNESNSSTKTNLRFTVFGILLLRRIPMPFGFSFFFTSLLLGLCMFRFFLRLFFIKLIYIPLLFGTCGLCPIVIAHLLRRRDSSSYLVLLLCFIFSIGIARSLPLMRRIILLLDMFILFLLFPSLAVVS